MSSTAGGSKRIGVAVIGAGLASGPHFDSLQALASRVDVRWLIGRGPERVAAAAGRFPTPLPRHCPSRTRRD